MLRAGTIKKAGRASMGWKNWCQDVTDSFEYVTLRHINTQPCNWLCSCHMTEMSKHCHVLSVNYCHFNNLLSLLTFFELTKRGVSIKWKSNTWFFPLEDVWIARLVPWSWWGCSTLHIWQQVYVQSYLDRVLVLFQQFSRLRVVMQIIQLRFLVSKCVLFR